MRFRYQEHIFNISDDGRLVSLIDPVEQEILYPITQRKISGKYKERFLWENIQPGLMIACCNETLFRQIITSFSDAIQKGRFMILWNGQPIPKLFRSYHVTLRHIREIRKNYSKKGEFEIWSGREKVFYGADHHKKESVV